jgi:hypothetical protein
MKVILSEQQFNTILQTESVAQLLQESFLQSKNLDNLKRKIKYLLATGVAISSIVAAINKTTMSQTEKDSLVKATIEMNADTTSNHQAANVDLVNARQQKDTLRQQKVEACREYMEYALRNQGYTMDSTGLKPETLVIAAEKTNFDLPFLMAVAHQESCFGATSRAQRSNSVFSEGAYDDGRDVVRYSDPNESVMGYIDLLRTDYDLDNGKTIFDFMKPGQFVNTDGNRYAQDKSYEAKISSIRRRIIRMHPELSNSINTNTTTTNNSSFI